MTELKKPKLNSSAQKQLDEAEKQFDAFEENINSLTLDRMNEAPKQELEPQTKISQRDMANVNDIYLKPDKTISCREPFNEKYRDEYDFAKEYVQFIAENHEIIGENIEIWTKPFAGVPAQFWKVPTNKNVWGPRYLAEQIKKASYHRLIMQENVLRENVGFGQMYGSMVADTTIQRLDARPVSSRKSIFMGASY